MSDDDKTKQARIARLRALMQKTTQNGCTEAEAQAAAAMVDKLLGEYEIDLTELEVKSQDIIQLDVECREHEVTTAALDIANFCDCRVWLSGPSICFLGLELDVEVAEYLTLLFVRAIDRETASTTFMNPAYAALPKPAKREFVHSFQAGMAVRLGERLKEMKSKRDWTAKGSGTDLVVVKSALVNQAYDGLGLKLGHGRGRAIKDTAAFAAGRVAGQGVALNAGVKGSKSQTGQIK
jgi:hypothetical protein